MFHTETKLNNIKLGRSIHEARQAKGLSTRKLAAAIGTTHSYIHKLEAGWFHSISPEHINALALTLDLDPQDLFSLAGYQVPDGLPTLVAYMRTKYGEELPEPAITEMSIFFDHLRTKYGGTGAIDDESEDPQEAHS